MRDPIDDLTLRIPNGDRRRRARKAASRGIGPVVTAGTVLSLLTAACVVVMTSDAIDTNELRTAAAAYRQRALIALGFGIDQVNLSGQRYALDSEIFDAIDLANVPTFADLDADSVRKRIERISWVQTAQITRVYPGTLEIGIQERVPAFVWSRGDASHLVDATGRVLGPVPRGQKWRLPRIAGEGAPTAAAPLFASLSRHPELSQKLAYAERVAERRWRLVLTSGSEIELAADREIEGLALLGTEAALSKALAKKPSVVDVRTPGRIAIRPVAALRFPAPGAKPADIR